MITDQLKTLWKSVFHDTDQAIDAFFETAYSPDRCRYLEADGQIQCALYWLDCEYTGGKLAYIYAVATAPAHRGKGMASQLLRQTHNQLMELGYAGAVLKPAEGLFPFYERLGYQTSGFIRKFRAEPAGPIPLNEVSTAAYAQLRRSFLPADAVIQEGATLDYLSRFARFFAGENALLSVIPEEQVVLEYLGDPRLAPGALAALGFPAQQLPTCGSEIPFVMHLPLNCAKAPGYLGISLE